MSEYENRSKRLKLTMSEAKVAEEKMMEDIEVKKSNFSSINPSNGAIVSRGSGNGNAKGDVRKLIIKNFKSE
jgi:hypothetical protein